MSRTFIELIAEAQPRELIATQTQLLGGGGVAYGLAADNADALAVSAVVDNQEVIAKLFAFNGTALDRLRSEGTDRDSIAVETLGNLKTINFPLIFDPVAGDYNRQIGTPAGRTQVILGGDQTGADGLGNTMVRPRGEDDTEGLLASMLFGFNGTALDRLRSEGNDRDGIAVETLGNLQSLGFMHGFNGTTWDRERNNVEATTLVSAARTTTTVSADVTSHNARGILIHLEASVNPGSAETLQIGVQAKDAVAGNYRTIALGTATIIGGGTGDIILQVYPGILDADAAAGDVEFRSSSLSRTFRIEITHSAAGSWTYSVSHTLIN